MLRKLSCLLILAFCWGCEPDSPPPKVVWVNRGVVKEVQLLGIGTDDHHWLKFTTTEGNYILQGRMYKVGEALYIDKQNEWWTQDDLGVQYRVY
jgi:hypothetical protein